MMEIKAYRMIKANYLVISALVACVFALYWRAFGADYVWDDLMYLGGFSHYQGIEGIVRAVSEPFFLYPEYYRPLVMLSFAISKEPMLQHGLNVALHAVNAVLVFQCARALMPSDAVSSSVGRWVPACAALLFVVHPLAVEAVAWVSGRFDALMCSFALLCCLAALDAELTRKKRLLYTFLSFLAALGCKEAAIGLPVALPFLLVLKHRLENADGDGENIKKHIVDISAMFVLALAIYLVLRMAVLPSLFSGSARATLRHGGLVDKLNVAAMAVDAFVRLIINPWSYSVPMHFFEYKNVGTLKPHTFVVVLSVLMLCVLTTLKKPRLNFPLALLGTLAMSWPALHLIGFPDGGNIFADRYALTPLALLLAALAAVFATWLRRQRKDVLLGEKRGWWYIKGLYCLWLCALAAHTYVTIPLWRNEMVFWPFVYSHAPASKVAYGSYIRILMMQERWGDADAEVKKFWKLRPDIFANPAFEDIINWMVIRAKNGDYREALDWFEKFEQKFDVETMNTGEEKRTLGIFYRARGIIEGDIGHWKQALYWHEKSVQVSPTDMRSAFRYAQALFMNGQGEKAQAVFDRALTASTNDVVKWAQKWRQTWNKELK